MVLMFTELGESNRSHSPTSTDGFTMNGCTILSTQSLNHKQDVIMNGNSVFKDKNDVIVLDDSEDRSSKEAVSDKTVVVVDGSSSKETVSDKTVVVVDEKDNNIEAEHEKHKLNDSCDIQSNGLDTDKNTNLNIQKCEDERTHSKDKNELCNDKINVSPGKGNLFVNLSSSLLEPESISPVKVNDSSDDITIMESPCNWPKSVLNLNISASSDLDKSVIELDGEDILTNKDLATKIEDDSVPSTDDTVKIKSNLGIISEPVTIDLSEDKEDNIRYAVDSNGRKNKSEVVGNGGVKDSPIVLDCEEKTTKKRVEVDPIDIDSKEIQNTPETRDLGKEEEETVVPIEVDLKEAKAAPESMDISNNDALDDSSLSKPEAANIEDEKKEKIRPIELDLDETKYKPETMDISKDDDVKQTLTVLKIESKKDEVKPIPTVLDIESKDDKVKHIPIVIDIENKKTEAETINIGQNEGVKTNPIVLDVDEIKVKRDNGEFEKTNVVNTEKAVKMEIDNKSKITKCENLKLVKTDEPIKVKTEEPTPSKTDKVSILKTDHSSVKTDHSSVKSEDFSGKREDSSMKNGHTSESEERNVKLKASVVVDKDVQLTKQDLHITADTKDFSKLLDTDDNDDAEMLISSRPSSAASIQSDILLGTPPTSPIKCNNKVTTPKVNDSELLETKTVKTKEAEEEVFVTSKSDTEPDPDVVIILDSNSRKRPASNSSATSEQSSKKSRVASTSTPVSTPTGTPIRSASATPVKSPKAADVEKEVTPMEEDGPAPAVDKVDKVDPNDADMITIMNDEMLHTIVRQKLNHILTKERENIVDPLRKRVSDLQNTNEWWKTLVVKLQKQITDLTILHQRNEHKMAAKKPAVRTVAVQVSTGVRGSGLHSKQSPARKHIPLSNIKPPIKAMVVSSSGRLTGVGSPALSIQSSHLQTMVNSNTAQQVIMYQPTDSNTSCIPVASSSNSILSNVIPRQQIITTTPTLINQQSTASKNLQTFVLSPPTTGGQANTGFNILRTNTNTLAQRYASSTVKEILSMQRNHPLQQSTSIQQANLPSKPNTQTIQLGGSQVLIDLTKDEEKRNKLASGIVQAIPNTGGTTLALQNVQPMLNTRGVGISGLKNTQIVLGANNVPMVLQALQGASSTLPLPTVSLSNQGLVLTTQPPQNNQSVMALVQGATPGSALTFQQKAVVSAAQILSSSSINSLANQASNTSTTLVRTQQMSQTFRTVAAPKMSGPLPVPVAVQRAAIQASTPPAPVIITSVTPAPVATSRLPAPTQHPAPLPTTPLPNRSSNKKEPPRPTLKISRVTQGIVLSWNMADLSSAYEEIDKYHLYAYQEGAAQPSTSLWKKVGEVKALPLPMACTLTQFQEGNRYHFAVRAMDKLNRIGAFSDPASIYLNS